MANISKALKSDLTELRMGNHLIKRDSNKHQKSFCKYCHGITIDDSKGNCLACGGERS
jgi:hypothetical protein